MLRRILTFMRSYGFAATAKHAFDKAYKGLIPPLRQVYCAYLADFVSLETTGEPLITVQAFPSFDKIPPGVLEDLFSNGTIDNKKPHSRAGVAAFLSWLFSRGAEMWACFENGILVGYLWALSGSRDATRYHFFPLSSRDAVFLAHEVFPPYRGRQLNRRMTYIVLGEMKGRGIERVFVDVEISNERSLKSFSKTPFKPIGRARMKDLKRRQFVVWIRQTASDSTNPDPRS
jgi:ribosomal protein S18 acetylase RimI-like enzyme